MYRKFASSVALLAGQTLHSTNALLTCPVSVGTLTSLAYINCKLTSGAILSVTGAVVNVSPAVFCASPDCYAVWSSLNSASMLACYQQYTVGSYRMAQADSGAICFSDNGGSPPKPPSAPSPAPQATSTPAAPTGAPTSTTKAPSSSPGSSNTGISNPSAEASNPSAGTSNTNADSSSTSAGETTSSTLPDTATTTALPDGSPGSLAEVPSTGGNETGTGGASDGFGADGASDGARSSNKTTSTGEGEASDGFGGGSPDTATRSSKNPSSSSSATRSGSSATSGANESNSTVNGDDPSSGSSINDDPAKDDGYSPVLLAAATTGGIVIAAFMFVYIRRQRESSANALKLDAIDCAGYRPPPAGHHVRRRSGDTAGFGADAVIAAARIPLDQLKRGVLISRGGYGEVYRGTYRDEVVAIKTLLPARRNDMHEIENFLAEVKIMAALEHDRIVRFIGVAWDALDELCAVSEFVARGDLRTLLAAFAAKPRIHHRGFANIDKIKIALHVAQALTYMHSLQPMVLHRDLKSRNILLDNNMDSKITDFGVSRERADDTMTIGVGTSLWMAPEVMTGGHYDDKADVFSFGVVLSELDTHMLPYSHAREPEFGRRLPDAVVVQMMSAGRLTVDFTEDSPMAQLGRRCVALDPKDRPSAAEVQHQIHVVLCRDSSSCEESKA